MWLPQCLSIGVPYETFGKLNPRRIKPFHKAFKAKKDEEIATMNYDAWLHGLYFSHSINANFGKNGKYPEKPIELGSKKESNPLSDSERFGAWAIAFNNSHGDLPEN